MVKPSLWWFCKGSERALNFQAWAVGGCEIVLETIAARLEAIVFQARSRTALPAKAACRVTSGMLRLPSSSQTALTVEDSAAFSRFPLSSLGVAMGGSTAQRSNGLKRGTQRGDDGQGHSAQRFRNWLSSRCFRCTCQNAQITLTRLRPPRGYKLHHTTI